MTTKREQKTIGFRLSGPPRAELERQAEALGVSPGELCRAVVERYLRHDESRAILESLEDLKRRHDSLTRWLDERIAGVDDELTSFRQDFKTALKAAK